MSETPGDDEAERESLREYARARSSVEDPPRRSGIGSFLRGCGIALGIAFLVFAFVVGACFIRMS